MGKNILKIVFLGIVGIGLLTYLTAEKPKDLKASEDIKGKISVSSLPKMVELVGKEEKVNTASLFSKGKTLLIVGNHDSLSVVKDLKNLFDVDMPYVMVANISAAPWFVKKWIVPSKLEELNENSKAEMIFDTEGTVVAALAQNDTTETKYFAYVVENGFIGKPYVGTVKEDAMDGSMSKEEKIEALKPVIDLFN